MLQPQYDENAFSDDVIARWGHLCKELAEDEHLLHVQMAHLGRLCASRPEVVDGVLRFLEDTVARSDAISEIENAVAISFLDWSEIQALGLKDALPSRISRIIKEQWERYQRGI